MKPITNTGDEVKALEQIIDLKLTIDSIGGDDKSDNIRKTLDELLTSAYRVLTMEDESESKGGIW